MSKNKHQKAPRKKKINVDFRKNLIKSYYESFSVFDNDFKQNKITFEEWHKKFTELVTNSKKDLNDTEFSILYSYIMNEIKRTTEK